MIGLIRSLFPIIMFGTINFLPCTVLKKSYGRCIPFTLISGTLIVYWGQMVFESFKIGLILLFLGSLLGIITFFFYRERIKNVEYVGSMACGILAFLCVSLLYVFVDYHRYFASWDEFSHWGMMIKEMFRLDDFYCSELARNLAHKEYPPFCPLFEFVWCKFSGGFSESTSSAALNILTLGMVVPVTVDMIMRKNMHKGKKYLFGMTFLVCTFTVFMIGTFDVYGTYGSIMPDYLIAVIFVWCMILIYDRQFQKGIFSIGDSLFLVVGLQALLLSKDIGLYFYLLAIFAFFLSFILRVYFKELCEWRTFASRMIVVILLPIMTLVSWKNRMSKFVFSGGGQFSFTKINIAKLPAIIVGRGTEVQRQTMKAYIKALMDENLFSGLINIKFITSIMLVIIIVVLLYKLGNDITKRTAIEYGMVCICGTLGYAFIMFVLYMFCFSDYESVNLASYSRYMSSYLLGEFLFLAYKCLECIYSERKERKREFLVWALVGILLFDWHSISYIKPHWTDYEADYRKKAEYIKENTEEWSTVLLIGTKANEKSHIINYCTDNRYVIKDIAMENDLSVEDKKKLLKEELVKSDYVYCMNPTKDVIEMLTDMCEDMPMMLDETLLEVLEHKWGLSLVALDKD